MFDDEEKEGDDIEIDHSSPQELDLSNWSENQWYNYFARCMVQTPPLMSSVTARAIAKADGASTRHIGIERFMIWIEESDFAPNGRFSHIFIPNYVYVPTEVLTKLKKITLNVTDVYYHVLWHKLYTARRNTAEAYQLQHTELKPSE
jgi:hypothetical protein